MNIGTDTADEIAYIQDNTVPFESMLTHWTIANQLTITNDLNLTRAITVRKNHIKFVIVYLKESFKIARLEQYNLEKGRQSMVYSTDDHGSAEFQLQGLFH